MLLTRRPSRSARRAPRRRRASARTNDTTKLGSVAPIPHEGGSSRCTWSTHQLGPVGESHWYATNPRPRRRSARRGRRGVEKTSCADVAPPGSEPVREQDGEEGDEARAEQEEERLEARELERERAERADGRREHDRSRCGSARERGSAARPRRSTRSRRPRPSPRPSARAGREGRRAPAGRDRRRERGRVGDVSRQEHDGAEREEERVGHRSSRCPCPRTRRAACVRSACSRPRAGSTRPSRRRRGRSPCQVERPPSPGRFHASSSPPPVSAHHARYAIASGTTQTASGG